MSLVPYPASDSDSESDSNPHPTPATKRRKISTGSGTAAEPTGALPPLPAAFLDQYSSNVRTSVQDDPALHGGRKRATPHVAGYWNAHVYLECKFFIFRFQSCSTHASVFNPAVHVRVLRSRA